MTLPCIVHLDLKGAPWRVDYLCKIIAFMKTNGAKGVLIEWEDTFPYTAELINIGSLGGCSRDGMYSLPEVQHILQCIKDNGMVPIQLVQTIGHLEYVLKQPHYRRLREYPRSPAVLCPTRPESRTLVKSMIRQVLGAQPDASYIHIGADEAWHMNLCADCQSRSLSNEHGSASLFLDHISTIAAYIKSMYPNISIMMWDDMIRNTSVSLMKAFNLGGLVQPVVWNYNEQEHFSIDKTMWERYSFVFPMMWAASAFKGANGSCQMICDVRRYASNQLAWHNELAIYEEEIKFPGIILTGWSRFDHFAAMCELLPVALPSLATCLRMWNQPGGFTNENIIITELACHEWEGQEVARHVVAAHEIRNRVRNYLDGDQDNKTRGFNPSRSTVQFRNGVTWTVDLEGLNMITTELGSHEWEGQDVARHVVAAHEIRNRVRNYLDGDQVTTWLNPWQVAHDYTSPPHVEIIANTAKQLQSEVQNIRRGLSFTLHALTGARSAEEYVQTFVAPADDGITALLARAELRSAMAAGVTPKSDYRRD